MGTILLDSCTLQMCVVRLYEFCCCTALKHFICHNYSANITESFDYYCSLKKARVLWGDYLKTKLSKTSYLFQEQLKINEKLVNEENSLMELKCSNGNRILSQVLRSTKLKNNYQKKKINNYQVMSQNEVFLE